MTSMVISNDSGMKAFHLCPACISKGIGGAEPCDETIPIYYSERNAIDKGWLKTNHKKFCEPGKKYVWVCPVCWPGDG